MSILTIISSIFNTTGFSVFLGCFLAFIIICIPSTSKFITYIHELGHVIHLFILYVQTKEIFVKPVINLSKKRTYLQYSGLTQSPMYTYLSENKPNTYNKIRLNAISGTLFVITVYLLIYLININNSVTLNTVLLCLIFLEISTFLTSTDFKYFIHPELFEYTPNK